MESNGSTSMASVCAGVLALLDAGVPLKPPVAGISVGLVTEFDGDDTLKRYTMLTDIIGSEDHFGDMDFKLCGTRDGVTGFQLDLKLPGLPLQPPGRSHPPHPRRPHEDPRRHERRHRRARAPSSASTPRASRPSRSTPTRSACIIGPGGKNIKGIVAESGAEINIEDDGTVHIYSNNPRRAWPAPSRSSTA